MTYENFVYTLIKSSLSVNSMKYPQEFFYFQTKSHQDYSSKPSGVISIPQLLQNKTHYWISPAPVRSIKPKKLILSDWTAHSWTSFQIEQIKSKIAELLEDGFEIYILQINHLESLTLENLSQLDSLEIRQAILPLFRQEIYDMTASHEPPITKDALMILDNYWLEQLIEPSKPRNLKISQLLSVSKQEFEKITKIQKKCIPPLEELILDLPVDADLLHFIREQFPYARLRDKISSLVLQQSEISTLASGESCLFKEKEFSPAQLSEIEVLNLEHPGENVSGLLRQMPKLKHLELQGARTNFEIILHDSSLPMLRTFKFFVEGSSRLQASWLSTLFRAAPDLEYIHLEKKISGRLASDLNLPKLKSLNISEVESISENDIILIKASKELKKLYYLFNQDVIEQLMSDEEIMSRLEHLEDIQRIMCQDISIVNNFLGRLQKLKSLGFEDEIVSLTKVYPQIVELMTRSAIFDITNLQTSLPNLKRITLKFTSINNFPENVFLPQLTHLELIFCQFPFKDFLKICGGAYLKELVLFSKTWKNQFSPSFEGFSALESLTIQGFSIRDLEYILQNSPQLKFIFLKDWLWKDLSDEVKTMIIARKITLKLSDQFIESQFINPQMRVADLPFIPQEASSEQETRMRTFTPHEDDEEEKTLQFFSSNSSQSQGMIIKKLSAYAKQIGRYSNLCDQIQDGMCVALAVYFNDISMDEWDNFNLLLQHWTGDTPPDPQLQLYFTQLFHYIHDFQISQTEGRVYFGDKIFIYVEAHREPLILYNPWHAIALKPVDEETWAVYDPNHCHGYQRVQNSQVATWIKDSLGTCISLRSNEDLEPGISDLEGLIQHGGLLSVLEATNRDKILVELSSFTFSDKVFEGLLLRAMSGKPTWILALENKASFALTLQLINLGLNKDKDKRLEELDSSLGAMTAEERFFFIAAILQNSRELAHPNSPHLSAIIELLHSPSNKSYFERQLQTWKTQKPKRDSLSQFCQRVCSDENIKRLIQLNSSTQIAALHFALLDYAQKTKRPIYYIHSAEDLNCSAPFIHSDGQIRKGPGGPLVDFLRLHTCPILLINYDNFKADDIVRFNTLLDDLPKVDGYPLSKSTRIIGLINAKNPNAYQGQDFYSRMDKVEICPISEPVLKTAIPVIELHAPKEESIPIQLYHARNWRELLLGTWTIKGDKLVHQPGLLDEVPCKDLCILNGPWDDQEFHRFWQTQIQNQAGFILSCQEGYDWDRLSSCLQSGRTDVILILNPSNFNEFIQSFKIEGSGLFPSPGYLERHRGQTLEILITRSLSDDQWAMFLDHALSYDLKLNLRYLPGVELPLPLSDKSLSLAKLPDSEFIKFIESSDPDASIQSSPLKDALIVDISELQGTLLTQTEGRLNQEELRFQFSSHPTGIAEALARGEIVVLKGQISVEMADELAIIAHQTTTFPGKLFVISEDLSKLSFVSVDKEEPDTYLKLSCLALSAEEEKELAPYLRQEPLCKLITRRDYLRLHPGANSDDAWKGLCHLARVQDLAPFDATTSAEQSKVFLQARKTAINDHLSLSPYVFLSGLSGVGKSTFIQNDFINSHDILYLGESKLKEWLRDDSRDTRKILFIDEANLSPKRWSEFEGLFQQPPRLYLDGKFYYLSAQHKIIFAGNPVSYSDERHLAPFFERHGNSLVLDPLPTALLYERILKPILDEDAELISSYILEVYRFLCACSTKDVLISPRELQMMALLIKVHLGSAEINELSQHFVYQIASPLVPLEHRLVFDEKFKPRTTLHLPHPSSRDYVVTASRQAQQDTLHQWLTLNEAKTSSTQVRGGLGGIVLEGDPGEGKSELVIDTLRSRDYGEVYDLSKNIVKRGFFRLPVSMPLAEKETCLIQAFHAGLIVIIDEVNSSPMMERLLNELLMGSYQGLPPKKPGFMIIATQNPVTLEGRRDPSTALSRRMTKLVLTPYSQGELLEILYAKGIPFSIAQKMSKAYLEQQNYARQNHLSPVPSFRDLMREAKHYLKNREKVNSLLTLSFFRPSEVTTTNNDRNFNPIG